MRAPSPTDSEIQNFYNKKSRTNIGLCVATQLISLLVFILAICALEKLKFSMKILIPILISILIFVLGTMILIQTIKNYKKTIRPQKSGPVALLIIAVFVAILEFKFIVCDEFEFCSTKGN